MYGISLNTADPTAGLYAIGLYGALQLREEIFKLRIGKAYLLS